MIALQPFDKTGFNRLMKWAADEETLMQFAGPSFAFPLDAAQLEKSLAIPNRLAFAVLYVPDQLVIGHAEIHFPDSTTALLCRILIGDTQFRGRGYGRQTVRQLLALSFCKPGIQQVLLNVFDWNTAAVSCYEKEGFRINKNKLVTRQVKGQTWTAMNMYIDKQTWQNR